MKLVTFLRFFRQIRGKKPVNIDKIQSMGLLAVKLGQIFALRPDLVDPERCIELQKLYSRAATIPKENSQRLIDRFAPPGFLDHFDHFDPEPFAAASIGQIHRATLKDGTNVVVKLIKSDFEGSFRRDVKRMQRWIRMGLFFNPKLRKVGNPLGLLAHIEDYTLRELDLTNEIRGRADLLAKAASVEDEFPMPKLRFPRMWEELSNRHVLVMEEIPHPTLEAHLDAKSLAWPNMLDLFRIHGAFMFGLGTFHGDLHPGNAMMDDEGNFHFIDTGAICHAPTHVRNALFGFFFFLAKGELRHAFDAMLTMADERPTGDTLSTYYASMDALYNGFVGTSVSEVSLTEQMMKTVKAAVLAGCSFGEEAFPIIRSLMYMDGMVLKGHPHVDLISSMGPYLDEFSVLIDPYTIIGHPQTASENVQ